MRRRFVIAGTGTDVGKTVFAAALVAALNGTYWKPVQSGHEGGTDTEVVARLTGLPRTQILPEIYVFSNPLSPHRAAELDGVEIDFEKLVAALPDTATEDGSDATGPLVIELAGGLLVPLTRIHVQTDLLQRWQLPVILVAATGLGTINHSLLSVAALKAQNVPLHGIAFVGDENADNEKTICDFAEAKRLGRLPTITPLEKSALVSAFNQNFRPEDFA